jgi:hypothetical protein
MGRQKLGWVESDKSPNPKSPYKVHILTLEWKKKLWKPMLNGPYVVNNQLIKFIWKVAHLKKYYMLGGKNINPTKNDQD